MVDEAVDHSDEDIEEDTWVDDGDTSPVNLEHLPVAGGSPSPVRWLAALAVVMLLGAGIIALRRPHKTTAPVAATPSPSQQTSTSSPDSMMAAASKAAGQGHFQLAAVQAGTAVSILERSSPSSAQLAQARQALARFDMKAGQFDDALNQYSKLLESDPDNQSYQALFNRAQGRVEGAKRHQADQAMARARVLFGGRDFNGALEASRRALALYRNNGGSDPRLASAQAMMGRSLYRLHSYAEAEQHLAQAVRLDGTHKSYRIDLAAVRAYVDPQAGQQRQTQQPRVIVITPKAPVRRYVAPYRYARPRPRPAAPVVSSPRPRRRPQPPVYVPPPKPDSGLPPPGGKNGLKSYYNTDETPFHQ